MSLQRSNRSFFKSLKASPSLFLGVVVLLFFSGCALTMSRPKLELSLAATAYTAAKEAKANMLAPSLFKKAEDYFLKAQSAYKKKYFNRAKEYALLSKEFSEKAEFEAMRQSALKPDADEATD